MGEGYAAICLMGRLGDGGEDTVGRVVVTRDCTLMMVTQRAVMVMIGDGDGGGDGGDGVEGWVR